MKTEVLEHQLCVKKFNVVNANVKLWLVLHKESDINIITIQPVLSKSVKLNTLKSHG